MPRVFKYLEELFEDLFLEICSILLFFFSVVAEGAFIQTTSNPRFHMLGFDCKLVPVLLVASNKLDLCLFIAQNLQSLRKLRENLRTCVLVDNEFNLLFLELFRVKLLVKDGLDLYI